MLGQPRPAPAADGVVYEHVWEARHAKRYALGKQIVVRIDREDPTRVAQMS